MIYDFWLKVGTVCHDIVIPIMIVCGLFRIYIYYGWKNRGYSRGIKFYDKFIENMAEEFKKNGADIVNFNKNKEE